MEPFTHRRTELASQIAANLVGEGFNDFRSGLFLAAPRRTGKTTFILNDLIPEMERRYVLCIYVDLWEDKAADPAKLIADAIREAIRKNANPLVKFARRMGIKVGWQGTGIDLEKIGMPEGTTLASALQTLHQATDRKILLVIDEAQRALDSEAGNTAMFGLKSARDTINRGSEINLMLAFTGSHRDKLSKLLETKTKPFYGAQMTKFPTLSKEYTKEYTNLLNRKLANRFKFDEEAVWEAFEICSYRPEGLRKSVNDVIGSTTEKSPNEALLEVARTYRQAEEEDIAKQFELLAPLDRAIVERIVETDGKLSPFATDSLEYYANKVGKEVTASEAQGAIEDLRKNGILWKEARGTYMLEDGAWVSVVRKNLADQTAATSPSL
jgi:hypothetical protein